LTSQWCACACIDSRFRNKLRRSVSSTNSHTFIYGLGTSLGGHLSRCDSTNPKVFDAFSIGFGLIWPVQRSESRIRMDSGQVKCTPKITTEQNAINCTKIRFDLIFYLIDPREQRRGRGRMRSGPTTGSGGTADDGLADKGRMRCSGCFTHLSHSDVSQNVRGAENLQS
jgi:hypothetical protein